MPIRRKGLFAAILFGLLLACDEPIDPIGNSNGWTVRFEGDLSEVTAAWISVTGANDATVECSGLRHSRTVGPERHLFLIGPIGACTLTAPSDDAQPVIRIHELARADNTLIPISGFGVTLEEAP